MDPNGTGDLEIFQRNSKASLVNVIEVEVPDMARDLQLLARLPSGGADLKNEKRFFTGRESCSSAIVPRRSGAMRFLLQISAQPDGGGAAKPEFSDHLVPGLEDLTKLYRIELLSTVAGILLLFNRLVCWENL